MVILPPSVHLPSRKAAGQDDLVELRPSPCQSGMVRGAGCARMRGFSNMRERTAGRLLVCLLVVAMLVGMVPTVALTAALQEGDNANADADAAVVDAVDDSGAGFSTDEDTPFTTASVLSNDATPNGVTLTLSGVDTTDTRGKVTDNG